MAGTLFGLPLSQQLDEDGDPYSGALLYVYEAETSTPADTYADSGLATLNAFPMVCDASGRIPQFWVEDGSYRARLTTAGGVEIFDEDSILAIGPSVASTGGGGGGGTSDTTAVFSTGDMKWKPVTGAETGWVRANARTIGSSTSGGTERASSDTQTLYEFLWNNFSDTLCPVVLGRGANALSDFNANKAIATLDMRGYGIFGLDDMGNSAVGRLTTGTPTAAASAIGAEKTTMVEANIATHDHGVNIETDTGGSHNHDYTRYQSLEDNVAGSGANDNIWQDTDTLSTSTDGSHTHTVLGDTGDAGSSTPMTTISPGRLGTWYLKL